MRQIYSFDDKNPPLLNEKKLHELALQKKLQKQTTQLATGGIMMLGLLLYMALLFRFDYPIYSILLIVYTALSLVGFAAILIIVTTKRREFKCVLPL